MPAAARITDLHTCPAHGGGPTLTGDPTVIIGYMPAARAGDQLVCPVPVPDMIQSGEPTVLIGNREAARMGDPTVHGGKIAIGFPTVFIGSTPQQEALTTDLPFCEECERRARAAAAAGGT
jgi:uncharacterized Zn-binding protein involved in type VI secretion